MTNQHEWIYNLKGNSNELFFILGPCVIESEEHVFMIAEYLKNLSDKLGFKFIFKASFDKANRMSLSSFRGVGIDVGLAILRKVRDSLHIPIITDVHECHQVHKVAEVVDVIQIPACLYRQTDLLIQAGKAGKPVFIKRLQFMEARSMALAVEKVSSTGNDRVWLGERGFIFGYNNLIVDMRNFAVMKETTKPVLLDATHAAQRPGGLRTSSGGNRAEVASLAASAVVQGIAGIFIEVHQEPEHALSDGPNSVRLSQLEDLLVYLIALDRWAKRHPVPSLF